MASIDDTARALACGQRQIAFLGDAKKAIVLWIGKASAGDVLRQLEDAAQGIGEGRTLLDLYCLLVNCKNGVVWRRSLHSNRE